MMTRRRLLAGAAACFTALPILARQATAEVEKRTILHSILRDCVGRGITPAQCSDEILLKLGHGPAFKLKADTADDAVHGAVMIRHGVPPEPHLIRIELYLTDSPPTGSRRAHLRAHPNLPPDAAIRALLDRPDTP